MTPILDIRELTIRRGDTRILDRLSWTVQRGEHWVVLGPNGCGKTSLLSALTGYFTPTDGSIHLLGEEFGASDWRELRQAVGIVSSSLRQLMHEEDCAMEIVAGGASAQIGHWGRIPKKAREAAVRALAKAEAKDIALRAWGVLSQGERQRVLIARALICRPRVLILDEPCAGLDPVAREHFLGVIERLARSRRAPAIVLVTHHVEEITPAFTHALLLRAGRAVACGRIGDALDSATMSAAFSTPMRLRKSSRGYALELTGWTRASGNR
ncbi:MAG: ATP-binding cassette domain-containing protein [Chthoniobacteraceae bacterium]